MWFFCSPVCIATTANVAAILSIKDLEFTIKAYITRHIAIFSSVWGPWHSMEYSSANAIDRCYLLHAHAVASSACFILTKWDLELWSCHFPLSRHMSKACSSYKPSANVVCLTFVPFYIVYMQYIDLEQFVAVCTIDWMHAGQSVRVCRTTSCPSHLSTLFLTVLSEPPE